MRNMDEKENSPTQTFCFINSGWLFLYAGLQYSWRWWWVAETFLLSSPAMKKKVARLECQNNLEYFSTIWWLGFVIFFIPC